MDVLSLLATYGLAFLLLFLVVIASILYKEKGFLGRNYENGVGHLLENGLHEGDISDGLKHYLHKKVKKPHRKKKILTKP